jgi:hypothetical protein
VIWLAEDDASGHRSGGGSAQRVLVAEVLKITI